MIIIGVICLVLGLILPDFGILTFIGACLIVVGCILLLVRPGGHHYY